MPTYDVLVRGGWVVDGTGAPAFRADVAVGRGRVEAVGAVGDAVAATVVDATDRLVLPGFVDAHVHADTVLCRRDVQEAMLRQGVTTAVVGQDGMSFAPGGAETVRYAAAYFAAINGEPPQEWRDGCTVADLLAFHDRSSAVNVAFLVPLGTVRHEILGPGDRRPSDDELARMVDLVSEGLEQGAVGVSTGLEYVPGAFSDEPELAALSRPAARVGAPHVSHLRSYADGRAPGMAELLLLAERAGTSVHASHYRGRAEPLVDHLDRARAAGLDVTFDSYPHRKANTILAMKALPATLQDSGLATTLRRLADPAVRARLAAEWFPAVAPVVAEAVIGFVAHPRDRWVEGLAVGAAAARADRPLGEFVCDLLLDSELAVGAVLPSIGYGGDDDVRALLRHPSHMGCSDGIYLGGHPHPRGWGAFARFLGRHTRELGDWTWPEAAVHLSGHPARRFGLAGRGLVRAGQVADLVVVDPARVSDRATYEEPRLLADGVADVLVAGEPVLAGGRLTGATPGRGLRRGEESW